MHIRKKALSQESVKKPSHPLHIACRRVLAAVRVLQLIETENQADGEIPQLVVFGLGETEVSLTLLFAELHGAQQVVSLQADTETFLTFLEEIFLQFQIQHLVRTNGYAPQIAAGIEGVIHT